MSDDAEPLLRALDLVIAAARLGVVALETPAERTATRAALYTLERYREHFRFSPEKQEPPPMSDDHA